MKKSDDDTRGGGSGPPEGGPGDGAPATDGLRSDLLAHADALFNVARRLTASPVDAEDLVQETYLRAIRARARFAPGSNLRAWLFRILRNAWIDSARSAARHAPDAADGEELPETVVDSAYAALRGDVELERMRGLVTEEIESALAALSPDARMVVLLDLEGFTEAEAADVMGCAVGTIKSRLARARAALRERLADYRR